MYGVEFYNTENCKYGREIANKGLAGLGYTDHVWVTGVIVDIVDVIHRLTVECTLFYGVLCASLLPDSNTQLVRLDGRSFPSWLGLRQYT